MTLILILLFLSLNAVNPEGTATDAEIQERQKLYYRWASYTCVSCQRLNQRKRIQLS